MEAPLEKLNCCCRGGNGKAHARGFYTVKEPRKNEAIAKLARGGREMLGFTRESDDEVDAGNWGSEVVSGVALALELLCAAC